MVSHDRVIRFGLMACAEIADEILRELGNMATTAALGELMEAVSHEMGFRYFALIHHDDLRRNCSNRVKILNYPQAIENRIIGQGAWRKDPVIRACIFTPCAFKWSDLPGLLTMDQYDLRCLEAGNAAGLDNGITVPFHLLGDCMGSCTFAGTYRNCRLAKVFGIAQMIGVFAFQAARRIVMHAPGRQAPNVRLIRVLGNVSSWPAEACRTSRLPGPWR
jgi:hypothetical protein